MFVCINKQPGWAGRGLCCDPFGRREREEEGKKEEERGGGGGETEGGVCRGGLPPRYCEAESGRGERGLAPGGGQLPEKTMRSRRGGRGGWVAIASKSESRKAEESPLGGRGWGEAQKKCTLEILEISLKEGEKEESIGERVGSRGLVVKPVEINHPWAGCNRSGQKERSTLHSQRAWGSGGLELGFLVICSRRNY